MATGNRGRQLPKFGEWETSDPAAAQGFTVIFNQARDNKKTMKTAVAGPENLLVTTPLNDEPQRKNNHLNKRNALTPRRKKKWLCFF